MGYYEDKTFQNETKCPICGRIFYPYPGHVYKLKNKKTNISLNIVHGLATVLRKRRISYD